MKSETYRRNLERVIGRPDWYASVEVMPTTIQLLTSAALGILSGTSPIAAIKQERNRRYQVIADLLDEDAICLGGPAVDKHLPNWDDERKDISTVVIHHSSRAEGVSRRILNAMTLARLYVPRYMQPDGDPDVRGQAIWSHHIDEEGKQVFYPYHWLIQKDGSADRLLRDEEVGWHSGDWDVNTESVALCFNDDLSDRAPTFAALSTARDILRDHYRKAKVVGHNETNAQVSCPGDEFATDGGWRSQLSLS